MLSTGPWAVGLVADVSAITGASATAAVSAIQPSSVTTSDASLRAIMKFLSVCWRGGLIDTTAMRSALVAIQWTKKLSQFSSSSVIRWPWPSARGIALGEVGNCLVCLVVGQDDAFGCVVHRRGGRHKQKFLIGRGPSGAGEFVADRPVHVGPTMPRASIVRQGPRPHEMTKVAAR